MKRFLAWKLLLVSWLLTFGMARAIEWPPVVAAKIDAVLALKQQAMDADSGMRSEDGKAGQEMDAMLTELAALLKKEGLEDEVLKSSELDIKEKIALWALDKEKRPEDYRRFSSIYVLYASRQGLTKEQFVAYSLNRKKQLDRIYTNSLTSITKSGEQLFPPDVVESRRLVAEYCLFAPPSGFHFYQGYKSHLMDALEVIGNPRSQVLYRSNLSMARKANERIRMRKENGPGKIDFHHGEEISGLLSQPDEETFRFLAELWDSADFQETVKATILKRMGDSFTDIQGISRREVFLMTWQDLARVGDNRGKPFSEWIATQKVTPLLRINPPVTVDPYAEKQ